MRKRRSSKPNETHIEEIDGIKYQTYICQGQTKRRRFVSTATHGMTRTRIWRIWKGMKCRCSNQNTPYYRFYGEKGISVCDEWKAKDTGFPSFYKWAMDNGYDDNMTIDRIDPKKGYCPENCQWITQSENSRRLKGIIREPKFVYYAYNESEKLLLKFYRARDFQTQTGLEWRRVSDGCKDENYIYRGWKFCRRSIENTDEGQETIPLFGSTTEDELPSEVRVINIPLGIDKDIVHTA